MIKNRSLLLPLIFLSVFISVNCNNNIPDKYELAFVSDRGGKLDIYLVNLNENAEPDSSSLKRIAETDYDEYGIDWYPDGKKIIFSTKIDNNYDVYTIDPDGNNLTRITDHPAYDGGASFSPDGKEIVFTSERADSNANYTKREFYKMNIDGSDLTRLTFNDNYDCCTHFSPDGKKILFARMVSDAKDTFNPVNGEIFVMDPDGKNEIQLTNKPKFDALPFWSPDGKQIAFHGQTDSVTQIFVMNADGTNLRNITNDEFDNRWPTWSPDGKWIAYTSVRGDNETKTDIFVTNPEGNIKKEILAHPKRDEIAIWNPVRY